MILLKWFQKRWRIYAVLCLLLLSFNLYFIFLMRTTQVGYLLYLDLLLLVFLAAVEGTAFFLLLDKGTQEKEISAGGRADWRAA